MPDHATTPLPSSNTTTSPEFVCTVCELSIPSINEWKVHELSGHYEMGGWLCWECLGSPYAIYTNREQLKEHRASTHPTGVTESYLDNCRVGKNWQMTYYCGFCIRICHQTSTRNEAHDERLNHIAAHYQSGATIADWKYIQPPKVVVRDCVRAVKLCTEGTSILSSRTSVIALPKKCTIIIRAEDGKEHTISFSQKLESAPLGLALIPLCSDTTRKHEKSLLGTMR